MWEEDVFLRTRKRHIRFKSLEKLYQYSCEYRDREEWMIEYMMERRRELIEDGLDDAMYDFLDWYESRKSRAKIHIRMVGKLLVWHHQSVRKLWDPSRPENHERLMEVYNS
jgi:hypothetical protein